MRLLAKHLGLKILLLNVMMLNLMTIAALPVSAGDASLQQRLAGIHSLQGNFSQQVLSADFTELERSDGQFKLLQPGYFSWHIRNPDEQLLVANGDSLLHYDVELETATRRNIGAEPGSSPLAILSGGGDSLADNYRIEQTHAERTRASKSSKGDSARQPPVDSSLPSHWFQVAPSASHTRRKSL